MQNISRPKSYGKFVLIVQLRCYCPDIYNVTPGHVNDEVQYYKPENAVQEQDGGEIVITAEKRPDGKIYSAR